MSHAPSTCTGKTYGLHRVCRVLGFPRSTIYAGRARESGNVVPLVAQRRGPKPEMPDAALLEAIRPIWQPRPLPARDIGRHGRGRVSCATSASPAPVCCV